MVTEEAHARIIVGGPGREGQPTEHVPAEDRALAVGVDRNAADVVSVDEQQQRVLNKVANALAQVVARHIRRNVILQSPHGPEGARSRRSDRRGIFGGGPVATVQDSLEHPVVDGHIQIAARGQRRANIPTRILVQHRPYVGSDQPQRTDGARVVAVRDRCAASVPAVSPILGSRGSDGE